MIHCKSQEKSEFFGIQIVEHINPEYSDFFLLQRWTVEQAFVSSEMITYICDTLSTTPENRYFLICIPVKGMCTYVEVSKERKVTFQAQ